MLEVFIFDLPQTPLLLGQKTCTRNNRQTFNNTDGSFVRRDKKIVWRMGRLLSSNKTAKFKGIIFTATDPTVIINTARHGYP